MVSRTPNVDIGNRYARDIVSGIIPACKWVRLACKRHLDDLEKSESDERYPYRFIAEEAEKAISICQKMKEIKGPRAGLELDMLPWQKWLIATAFGWYVKSKNGDKKKTAATRKKTT